MKFMIGHPTLPSEAKEGSPSPDDSEVCHVNVQQKYHIFLALYCRSFAFFAIVRPRQTLDMCLRLIDERHFGQLIQAPDPTLWTLRHFTSQKGLHHFQKRCMFFLQDQKNTCPSSSSFLVPVPKCDPSANALSLERFVVSSTHPRVSPARPPLFRRHRTVTSMHLLDVTTSFLTLSGYLSSSWVPFKKTSSFFATPFILHRGCDSTRQNYELTAVMRLGDTVLCNSHHTRCDSNLLATSFADVGNDAIDAAYCHK